MPAETLPETISRSEIKRLAILASMCAKGGCRAKTPEEAERLNRLIQEAEEEVSR